MLRLLLLILLMLVVVPVAWAAASYRPSAHHWSVARWDSAGLAPPPPDHPDAIVQVYAARAWGWKGIVAVHSWLAFKPAGAAGYERYDVVGWGVSAGRPAVRRNIRPVDGYWAGNRPQVVAELRGPAAEAAIPAILDAIASYPAPNLYLTWPGPNSNSFVAHVLRRTPGLDAALPPLAIGKDYLPGGGLFAAAPSGTGFQVSVLGLLGLTLAAEEGLEVNLLGLVFGLDPGGLALKLPGVGSIGLRPRT
jgi:hypothetical protein